MPLDLRVRVSIDPPLRNKPLADSGSISAAQAASDDDAPGDSEPPSGRPSPRPGALPLPLDDAAGPKLSLCCETERAEPLATWLEAHAARAAAALTLDLDELTVVVVDDATMQQLHEDYQGDPTTTDVLTFDLRDHTDDAGPIDEPASAEIVICLDEAERCAAQWGHAVRAELLLYTIHGLVHLAGGDDTTEAGAAEMRRRERAVFEAIGQPAIIAMGHDLDPGHADTADPQDQRTQAE